ncbi:cytochrome bd-I oxidase subunit CydX [Enterobacillus tribolii]|uniref:Cyd operon protein YbgT n=1 Tax=Enterobacillus tribolii TaxID=1487935 RepID=A0A370QHK1_9GAMM|nr:cytochrome bd-I oxidase subunit CydX [Enterobacillus tribolii]MBW7982565.1 cytochrome bd-I oxidase subunit CydX [Enterobacillus tribolii]RDK87845.1 cyd operon protein YbgT [Enterobacillus tribolii]
MWYFAWILGTLLACFFAIITAMTIENNEAKAAAKDAK